jgi:hypothetical protein
VLTAWRSSLAATLSAVCVPNNHVSLFPKRAGGQHGRNEHVWLERGGGVNGRKINYVGERYVLFSDVLASE